MSDNESVLWFKNWYLLDVKPKLGHEAKVALCKKLSELSQKYPFSQQGLHVPKSEVEELVPFSNTDQNWFSGWQLYAVYTELFNELYGKLMKRG